MQYWFWVSIIDIVYVDLSVLFGDATKYENCKLKELTYLYNTLEGHKMILWWLPEERISTNKQLTRGCHVYVIARMCLLPSCFDQFNKLPLLPCFHSKTIGNNYFVLILIKRNVFNGMTRRQWRVIAYQKYL